jgi:hypothetical protein
MLPVEIVVWAKPRLERSNADKAAKTNIKNRALGREELSFNIVDLPFGIVLTGIVLATPLPEGFLSGSRTRKS